MSQETAKTPKIKLSSITKAFDVNGARESVLESVNVVANSGEYISIIGPSRCGKSTLLNIIAGLDDADGGMVEMESDASSVRLGRIGYMQQKDLLLPWRSVIDNTILGLELHGHTKKEARQRAFDLVEIFGLKGFEHQYPQALSGGMRQRAAFLRTMLINQDVILLDEPFGALDALTRVQMQEWLLRVWESLNKTIVLITHDVDEALLLSDRIYLMTARPGRAALALDVNLPRPRRYDMVTTQAFSELKARLMTPLRLQIQAAS